MFQYNLKYGRIDTFFLYQSNLNGYFNQNLYPRDIVRFEFLALGVKSITPSASSTNSKPESL